MVRVYVVVGLDRGHFLQIRPPVDWVKQDTKCDLIGQTKSYSCVILRNGMKIYPTGQIFFISCSMGGVNKREHLIRTGQELIWSKGYDLCSIKDITTAAGLPKGSFYHYFESKEKFALEAMDDFLETFPENLPTGAISLDKLRQLIDARIESIIRIHFTRECYMSVMCHAVSDQEADFRLAVVAGIDTANQTMQQLLTQLHENQLINPALEVDELLEFVDFAWRGARLKAKMLQSDKPLRIFKKYLFDWVLKVD